MYFLCFFQNFKPIKYDIIFNWFKQHFIFYRNFYSESVTRSFMHNIVFATIFIND